MGINFNAKTVKDRHPEKNKGWEKKGITLDSETNAPTYIYHRTFRSGPGHKMGRYALGALIVLSSLGLALISKKVRNLFARVEVLNVKGAPPSTATNAAQVANAAGLTPPLKPSLRSMVEQHKDEDNPDSVILKLSLACWEELSGLQDLFSQSNLFKLKKVILLLIDRYFNSPLFTDNQFARQVVDNLEAYSYDAYETYLKTNGIPPEDLFKSSMQRTKFIEDALDLSAKALDKKYRNWLPSLTPSEKKTLNEEVMRDLPLSDWIQLITFLEIPFTSVQEKLDSKPWLELTICQEGLAKGAQNIPELKQYLISRFNEAIQHQEDLTFEELDKIYHSFFQLMEKDQCEALMDRLKPSSLEPQDSLETHSGKLLNLFLKGEAPGPLLEKELDYIRTNIDAIKGHLFGVAGEEYLAVLGVLLEKLPIERRIEFGRILISQEELFSRYQGDAAFENLKQDMSNALKIKQLKWGLLLGIVDLSKKVNGTPLLHGLIDADLNNCKELLDGLIVRWDEQDEKNGNTLLHLLIEKGNLKFAKYLIKEGARVDLKNFSEITPLQLAKEKGHHDLATRIVLQVMGELRREEQGVPSKKRKMLATPIAATIRQAKNLNHLKELNKKDFQKTFGGKIVPKPLRGVGNVFNFAGATVQVWEADTAYLAQIKSLQEEIEALQSQEKGATSKNATELRELIGKKREEITRIETERSEARTKHGLEAGVALMHAGAYGAKAFNVGWQTVKGSMPLLSACTTAFNVYKTLAELNSVDDKIKLLSSIVQQIEYEKAVLQELKKGLAEGNPLLHVLDLKFNELERKSEYLIALTNNQQWSKGLEQFSAGTTAVTAAVTLVGTFMFPIALPAIATKAAMAAGFAPAAYSLLLNFFSGLKEKDFAPVTTDNFEKRRPSIAKRLGIEEKDLDHILAEKVLKTDDATCKKLLKISGIVFEDEKFSEEKKVHLLNYLMN